MPNYYDRQTQLNEYLVFHYGDDEDILNWEFGPKQALGFHQRLVNCIDKQRISSNSRGLDLGCAVGRVTFELARYCESVIGIDYSEQFIAQAQSIKLTGKVKFKLTREGMLGDLVERRLPRQIDRERVSFRQADAEELPESIGKFDVVILANLLDRLAHPQKALAHLSAITNPGAQVVICSPFTWWDDFTSSGERLGGFVRNDQEVTSMDTIETLLRDDFQIIDMQDQPFLIREHERKYHFSVAHVGIWLRR